MISALLELGIKKKTIGYEILNSVKTKQNEKPLKKENVIIL